VNPIATQNQKEIERLALRIIEAPAVRAARENARRVLLKDPVIEAESGRAGLERALDQWTLALAMRVANGDPARPRVVWSVDNTPRHWFGHIFPGAAVAVDNPDNVNREIPIHSDYEYELSGQFAPNRTANFSLKLELEPEGHAGLGTHANMLLGPDIKTDADGRFTVTLARASAEGKTNYIQISEGRQSLFARDSFSDWRQTPTALSIRCVSGKTPPAAATEAELTDRVADFLPEFVRAWAVFKDTFYGNPPPNTIVGPIGREASWGFLAGGRFELADDEALVITTTPGTAKYTGFQVADVWTIAPDPLYRQSSLNASQRALNPDGSATYVIALLDPGVHNWIDPCGLHEGWFNLRWQGFTGPASGEGLIRGCQLVKLAELETHLPAGCPRADLAARQRLIAARAPQYLRRHAE
jgi:hypothetical protein